MKTQRLVVRTGFHQQQTRLSSCSCHHEQEMSKAISCITLERLHFLSKHWELNYSLQWLLYVSAEFNFLAGWVGCKFVVAGDGELWMQLSWLNLFTTDLTFIKRRFYFTVMHSRQTVTPLSLVCLHHSLTQTLVTDIFTCKCSGGVG